MKSIFLLLIILTPLSLVYGQDKIQISGAVYEAGTQQTIPFAYIKLKNIALGTVTNSEGIFNIAVPKKYQDAILEFSYLGFQTKEYKISELNPTQQLNVYLKVAATTLSEIIIKPEKALSATQILKKVIKAIPINYPQEAINMEGYYRELVKENGVFIRYADAVTKYHYAPYNSKGQNQVQDNSNKTNFAYNMVSYGNRMHRYHFHQNTYKNDQAIVLEARASEDQTKTHLTANIEGGPMGLMSKDRMKFKAHFINPGHFNKYIYDVGELQDKEGKWQYVISFKPDISEEKLAKAKWKFIKVWPTLSGKIYINQENFAVTAMEYGVTAPFKKLICGYKGMNVRHFGYNIRLDYKKINDKYIVSHIRQEDEFITVDTVENITTPYAAISEVYLNNYESDSVKRFDAKDILHNGFSTAFFEYPSSINERFWVKYSKNNSHAIISEKIRKDMEENKKLETQFVDRLFRDENLLPPVAKKIPQTSRIHQYNRVDNYQWLKDTSNVMKNDEIMDYLDKENYYVSNYFRPLKFMQRKLFDQMINYMEMDERSLPVKDNGYLYYHAYHKDQDHRSFYRKPIKGGKEELILDSRKYAKDKAYYSVGGLTISPNNKLMAYFENTTGTDEHLMKIKNLESGGFLQDSISGINNMEWINNDSFLYILQEKKSFRSYQLKRHVLGTPFSQDELLYEEKDKTFGLSIKKSKSKEYIFLRTASSNASETYFLNISSSKNKLKLMYPRKEGHTYFVSHYKDKFYIRTNDNAINYKIVSVVVSDIDPIKWNSEVDHNPKSLITDFMVFDNYYVVSEKTNAFHKLKIIDRKSQKSHYIKGKENIASLFVNNNPDFDTDTLQFSFTSFRIPTIVYNYHMGTKKKREVKKIDIEKKYRFSAMNLKTKRIKAVGRDGEEIPITLLYRKKATKVADSLKKVYLTSYGSYGTGNPVYFKPSLFPLLDQGFIYAIAHVRGSNDKGMNWYHDGKLLNKMNTFTDFIDCAEHLINEGYVQKGNIVAQGESAGGLLMGAVANMAPELFHSIILDVPFVDVVNTMLDDKLPLTTGEYKEWGNPNEKKYYDYMMKYSPYDNVKKQDYPHMIFTTSVNDTRVGYWEPAKMVAKLRAQKTNENYIFLKTNYHGGHGGNSGRFSRYKHQAYNLALVIELMSNK